jgi:hypothetical protein
MICAYAEEPAPRDLRSPTSLPLGAPATVDTDPFLTTLGVSVGEADTERDGPAEVLWVLRPVQTIGAAPSSAPGCGPSPRRRRHDQSRHHPHGTSSSEGTCATCGPRAAPLQVSTVAAGLRVGPQGLRSAESGETWTWSADTTGCGRLPGW